MTRPFLAFALVALAPVGCVSKVNYDRCVAGAAEAHAAAEAAQKDAAAQIQSLTQQVAAAQTATQECDAKVSDLSTASHNTQAQIDEATAINQQLRDELVRLGKDVDKILAERGTLSKALDDAKARLDELRKAQAAAEARLQLFRDFAVRLKHLVDAGQAHIETRRGRLVIELQGDLLFDEGRADLRSAGKGTLMEVARALQTTSPAATGRQFLVATHGDDLDVPRAPGGRAAEKADKARRFKSAWELTAGRAVAVVEYLVSCGVPPAALTAGGAGSFDPLVPGDSADGRSRNRRVEITLLSSVDDPSTPVAAPAAQAAPAAR